MSRSTTHQQRQQQKLDMQQQQHQQQLLAQQQQKIAENEATAAASDLFDYFCQASTMRNVLGLHRNMCELIGLRPAPLNDFYPKLKARISSWKAQALWKKFDTRAAHRVYGKGNACTGTRVLVIGGGPCGLRTAIEAQLLGAKVVVVEKRDRISRNNVLHLWPFVITDLRNLGAKKFYGKFCAGSIDHISIRQLQCILLKVALLLGVEIHEGVSFEGTIEPSGDGCGWRAAVSPSDHAVSHYEFDVLIGADGKRNTLEGFKRKEFRGKLAIAITANFINKKSEAEAKAEEISGVAFIFNQSFFKELYHTTGIDLENIVYYKDETHYFVMTAKKHSLIDKGVIMQDFADPAELLAPANVNTDKLLDYAREAAEFSTKYQMPDLEFAVNHYGKPDVAMFDFTSMFAAETSCRVIVRKGFRLLQCLVGDSLLEPFWPTGSGCARGFLSSMDAAYAIKLWSNPHNSTLGVLAQRESIYRLLNQTTPENLQRDIGSYTVDPATRYPNLNRTSVNVWQVKHLIDTDDKSILEQTFMDTNALQGTQVETPVRRKRRSGDSLPLSTVLLRWICAQLHSYEFTKELKEVSDVFTHGKVLCALINRYRPDLVDFNAIKDLSPIECNELAFKILDKDLHIPRVMSGKESIQLTGTESKVWLNYLEQICELFRGEIPHVKHPKMDFSDLREKYRFNYRHAQPDFSKLLQFSSKQNKAKAIGTGAEQPDSVDVPQVMHTQRRSVLDEEKLKRQRAAHATSNAGNNNNNNAATAQAQNDTPRRAKKRRSADKAANIDRERGDIPSALPRSQTDEQFSDRIKSMEQRISTRHGNYASDKKPKDLMRAIGKIDSSDWNVREIEKKIEQSKKTEIHGPKGREKVPKWSKEQFLARQTKMAKPQRQDSREEEKFREIDQTLKNLDKQLKEGHVLDVGERGRNKVASIAGQFVKKDDTSEEKNPPTTTAPKSSTKVALAFKKQAASEKCHFCKQTVYLMEKVNTEGLVFHRSCLKCHHCHTNLRMGNYAFDRDDPNGRFYCTQHYRLPAKAIRPVVRKSGQKKSAQQHQAAASNQNVIAAAAANDANGTDSTVDGAEPQTPDKLRVHTDNVAQLDMLDRGQTPERIEFENTDAMSDGGEPSEEHIIDEHEWSGRNFLPESNNDSESDLSSSDESDTESDSELYEVANESPLGAQTLQLANDWIGKQHYTDSDDSNDSYDSSDGIVDDGKDDTDGEEFKKAREMRREEVRLLPLPPNLPTDTETEPKISAAQVSRSNENKENMDATQSGNIMSTLLPTPDKAEKVSLRSSNSEKSFKSATSSPVQTPTTLLAAPAYPTRADMEKIEQNSERKFSAEIEAISEKLYRLNNMVKMNKDIETIAKENMVKSDILKKLTLKEKWLAENANSANVAKATPATQFDEKFQKLVGHKQSTEAHTDSKSADQPPKPTIDLKELMPRHPDFGSSKTKENQRAAKPITQERMPVSRDNSFKSNTNTTPLDSPKAALKSDTLSRNNSLKKSHKINLQAAMSSDGKMQIENILDIVKKMDISNNASATEVASSEKDIGRLLYDAEHKFSPKPNKRLNAKMKEIETQNFAGTMDSIKAQLVMPKETVSAQAATSVDLAKYFPNQKQEKSVSNTVNKNQKNLKDVDLTKYFPSSPVPQRRSNVVTVAEKLKKSQTEKALAPAATTTTSTSSAASTQAKLKRQQSLGTAQPTSSGSTTKSPQLSLRDHQLDGAVDLVPKKSAVKVSAVNSATTTANKPKVKIIKKLPAKANAAKPKKTAKAPAAKTSKLIVPDESDKILMELLQQAEGETTRSPSLEYQKLFQEEKSPSDDVSDKIERILEETGIDLGTPSKPRSNNPKKLVKALSLNEAECAAPKPDDGYDQVKEDGDRPSGVKNILKRFESMSSAKSDEQIFKLRRMESSTGQLNKSRESMISQETLGSTNDLEKTMDYLRNEWRSEATNFLQKKRDNFYAQKREEELEQAKAADEAKRANMFELPVQYRDSKLAKFFGLRAKSPEKRKSPDKKQKNKSPQKAQREEQQQVITQPKNSLEELANISNAKQAQRTAAKAGLLHAKQIEAEPVSEISQPPAKVVEPAKTADKPQRPLVEDIRNLPKTGCDKSLNSSRRGSQSSLHSRRLSNSSLQEQLEQAVNQEFLKNDGVTAVGVSNKVEAEQQQERTGSAQTEPAQSDLMRAKTAEELAKTKELLQAKDKVSDDQAAKESRAVELDKTKNSSNELVEKQQQLSPTAATSGAATRTELKQRGSSENDSIDQLFSQLSDEMLVNVDFDSNDELIVVKPSKEPLNAQLLAPEQENSALAQLTSAESVTIAANPVMQQCAYVEPNESGVNSNSGSKEQQNETMQNLGEQSAADATLASNLSICQVDHALSAANPNAHEMTSNCKAVLVDKVAKCEAQPNGETMEKITANLAVEIMNENIIPAAGASNAGLDVKSAVAESAADSSVCTALTNGHVNVDASASVAERLANPFDTRQTHALPSHSALDAQFPPKPQRRHKSKSSSSESPTPIAPQRVKKKLAALNPTDMPPSVQDLLREVCIRQKSVDEAANVGATKFPTTFDDTLDEPLKIPNTASVEEGCKQQSAVPNALPIEAFLSLRAVNGKLPSEEPRSLQPLALLGEQLPVEAFLTNKPASRAFSSSRTEQSEQAGTKQLPVEAFLTPKALIAECLPKQGSVCSAQQPMIDLEVANATNVVGLPGLNNNLPKIITPPKRQSKEPSLEWDMEKMPASPMPRRKFILKERAPSTLSDVRLRDVSPSSSIKVLNNLPDESADAEQRLIQVFEKERRQALVKRDQSYQEIPKPVIERTDSTQSSSNKSAANTSSTNTSSLLTPSKSRRAGTQESIFSNREVTPPNFKKLTLPSDETTAQSSRRSSFAFLDLENSEPIIAPMPKKLNVPKYEPKYVPEPAEIDADAEVFKNRPWPKTCEDRLPELDEAASDEDNANVQTKTKSPTRTPSPVPEVFKNRQWPDGKTDFSQQRVTATPPPKPLSASDDIEVLLAKRRAARRHKETLSQSPPASTQRNVPAHLAPGMRQTHKDHSKSISDLHKNTPLPSAYSSTQSLHKLNTPSTTRSSYSSMDTDYKSNATAEQRPTKRTQIRLPASTDDVDASTRMLLDRSKRLHNRKRDFVNERVVERNPYMRDVVASERLANDIDEEVESYRPSYLSTAPPATSRAMKFPTSRALGRSHALGSSSYDYLSAAKPSLGSYDSAYSSNRYNVPTSTSHIHYPGEYSRQPLSSSIGTTRGLYRSSPNRSGGSHLIDYFKRSRNDRESSKESCVLQ